MEREPNEHEKQEALDWLLKEKEGQGIKISKPKEERRERGKNRKKIKKLIANFGQKELFPEK